MKKTKILAFIAALTIMNSGIPLVNAMKTNNVDKSIQCLTVKSQGMQAFDDIEYKDNETQFPEIPTEDKRTQLPENKPTFADKQTQAPEHKPVLFGGIGGVGQINNHMFEGIWEIDQLDGHGFGEIIGVQNNLIDDLAMRYHLKEKALGSCYNVESGYIGNSVTDDCLRRFLNNFDCRQILDPEQVHIIDNYGETEKINIEKKDNDTQTNSIELKDESTQIYKIEFINQDKDIQTDELVLKRDQSIQAEEIEDKTFNDEGTQIIKASDNFYCQLNILEKYLKNKGKYYILRLDPINRFKSLYRVCFGDIRLMFLTGQESDESLAILMANNMIKSANKDIKKELYNQQTQVLKLKKAAKDKILQHKEFNNKLSQKIQSLMNILNAFENGNQ